MNIKNELEKKVNEYIDYVFNKLKQNKDFLKGMSVGAFLMTPPGREIVKGAAHWSKSIATLSKEVGIDVSKAIWTKAIESKLGKTNLAANAIHGEGKVGKFAKGVTAIAAAQVAGKAIGASLGKTIAAGQNWWQHINPVSATIDIVQVLKEEHDEKKEAQRKAAEPIKQLINEIGKYSATGEKNKISVYSGINYDEEAKKLGLSTRPSNVMAENEWKKEVEKQMSKQGKKPMNHPTWYGEYPEYVTSNLQWGERKEDLGPATAAGSQVTVSFTIPQTEGKVSQAYKDAINMIYVKVRGSNSGAFNYDPEDVSAYIECNRSIRALHSQLVRDLKLVNNVDPYIIQTPDIMLGIAGYNAAGIADIKANRIIYINELNQLRDIIENRFPIPPNMKVFDRGEYVATAIIEEGKGPKSSVYIYRLGTLLQAKGSNTQDLEGVQTDINSFATRLGMLRTMIDNAEHYANMSYSPQTFAKIAGDMMKAYGNAAFRKPLTATIDEKAQVVFDQYLLTQIQNAVGAQTVNSDLSLVTDAPAYSIQYTKTIRIDAKAGETNTIPVKRVYGLVDSNNEAIDLLMNSYKKDINGLEVLSLTRLVDFAKIDATDITPNTNLTAVEYCCGTEVVSHVRMFLFDPNAGTGVDRFTHTSFMNEYLYGYRKLALWSQIDYSPIIQVFDNSDSTGKYDIMIDLDTYAHMTMRQFQIFTTTCVLSLYKTVGITQQVNFRSVKK